MTDFLALANEAICYEGSDTYLGATSEQLADVLAANTDLWTPATDDTSWSIDDEDGFMAALAAKVNPETPLSARKAAAEGTDNDPVATGFAGVAPTNLPRRPAWSPEPEWLGCADPGQGKRIRAAVSSMWGTTRDNRGVAAVLIGATADPDTGNQHGDVDIRVRVMAWGGFARYASITCEIRMHVTGSYDVVPVGSTTHEYDTAPASGVVVTNHTRLYGSDASPDGTSALAWAVLSPEAAQRWGEALFNGAYGASGWDQLLIDGYVGDRCDDPTPAEQMVLDDPDAPETVQHLLLEPPVPMSVKRHRWGHGESRYMDPASWRNDTLCSAQLAASPYSQRARWGEQRFSVAAVHGAHVDVFEWGWSATSGRRGVTLSADNVSHFAAQSVLTWAEEQPEWTDRVHKDLFYDKQWWALLYPDGMYDDALITELVEAYIAAADDVIVTAYAVGDIES